MTKYVLLGGYAWKAADGGKAFAETLVKGHTAPVKFLICLFARPEKLKWLLFAEDKSTFSSHLPESIIDFRLANVGRFIEQVQWADVIYFRGGKTQKLIEKLDQNVGWEKKLEGKTVAGASAGANMMAKYYYGLDKPGAREGLGLLPIKTIVHWKSDYNAPNIDWDKAYAELKTYGENLHILTLPEGSFTVIEK